MPDLDQIHIRDLLLRAIIGINEDERLNRQDVLINMTLYADTRAAAETDRIEDAVNYRSVTKRVIEFVEHSRCFLVERLVAEIAEICLEDRRVQRVDVSVEKPSALRFARSVGISITREQGERPSIGRGRSAAES